MAEKTQHVLDELPQHQDALRERMLLDGEFRSPCEDYGDAFEALRLWEASADGRRAARVKEFARLLAELESEILAELGVHWAWRGPDTDDHDGKGERTLPNDPASAPALTDPGLRQ